MAFVVSFYSHNLRAFLIGAIEPTCACECLNNIKCHLLSSVTVAMNSYQHSIYQAILVFLYADKKTMSVTTETGGPGHLLPRSVLRQLLGV